MNSKKYCEGLEKIKKGMIKDIKNMPPKEFEVLLFFLIKKKIIVF